MNIEAIWLHFIEMPLKIPFQASWGTLDTRPAIVVEVYDGDGRIGLGEGLAFAQPYYTEETIMTSWHILDAFLIPLLYLAPIAHPAEVHQRFARVRGNAMAKAALDSAVWDLYAQEQGSSLATVLGGQVQPVPVRRTLGLAAPEALSERMAEAWVEEEMRCFKLKIQPGADDTMLEIIRRQFPDADLAVDANGSYEGADVDLLTALDRYQLTTLEQPLAAGDFIGHARLQAGMTTAVGLDESLVSLETTELALALRSCRAVNLKWGRVGGLTAAIQIHNRCRTEHIELWCGGMFETGIGRAHSLALSTLPGFTLPADLGPSRQYWERDLVFPELLLQNGTLPVPGASGIGVRLDRERLDAVTKYRQYYPRNGTRIR